MVISPGLMWVLSMSMARTLDHVSFNLGNLYMALIMVSAMGVVMVVGMWSMLKNTKATIALPTGFAALFVLAFSLGRTETFVSNKAFLKSMIPHHSRTILVCHESAITDPEIEQPCREIVQIQREETTQWSRPSRTTDRPSQQIWSTMNTTHRTFPNRKLATILALATAAGITAGCGTNDSPELEPEAESSPAQQELTPGAETPANLAYTGPYDEDFRADLSSYAGQQVTLTGEVADLVPSRSSLVLTAPEDPELEPLLVTARYAFPDAEDGAVVEVTGTVQTNFQARVDHDDVDQEAGFYDRHIGQPYLDQAELSTTEPAGT